MFIKKIVFAAMFIIITFANNSHAGETWKITSLNWEPYSGLELPDQGSSIQKLREILGKEGIRLIVEFYPWKRAQYKAKTKEYVGYFPAWPEEAADNFIVSLPVDWSEVGILKQSGSRVNFESIDALFKKYNVGVVQTYVYPKLISDAMKKYPDHVDRAPNEISLLKKLSAGRHSVAITDPNVMMYLAGKEGITNVETLKIIMKKKLIVAFRDDEDNRNRIHLLKKLLKDL